MPKLTDPVLKNNKFSDILYPHRCGFYSQIFGKQPIGAFGAYSNTFIECKSVNMWIRDNIDKTNFIFIGNDLATTVLSGLGTEIYGGVAFKNEEDLLMFKLVWGFH